MIEQKIQDINDQTDQEWLELIFEAKKLGLSYDEIREYFEKNAPIHP